MKSTSIDCKKASEIVTKAMEEENEEKAQQGMFCLRGVFEYAGSNLSPIEKIEEILFEYVKAKEPIVKEEEDDDDDESAESKDIFSLKRFNLTIK